MTQLSNILREQLFEQTESLSFNVTPERPSAAIPANHEAAYKAGYEDALIDAKVYFRMALMRILGEKQ